MAQSADLPLRGIRVLDLTSWWAGPFNAMILADLGAEVIKIEAIQRLDNWRATLADRKVERWWEASPLFNSTQRNKCGITLNLANPRGVAIFKELVKRSDVVCENYSPRVMPQLGIAYEVLREINPRLIMISQTGFGSTGPWRDYVSFAQVAETLAGLAHLTGSEGGPPSFAGQMLGDTLSAMHGALAVLLALDERSRSGRGQHIDLSQLETVVPATAQAQLDSQMNGRVWHRVGNRHWRMAPHGCYPARGEDRWIVIAIDGDVEWNSLVAAMGNPPWTADARFATAEGRLEHAAQLDELISGWTRERERDELANELQRRGLKAGPVLTPIDLLNDRHLKARGFFQMVERAVVGTKPYPTLGIRFSKTPAMIRTPAPTLGEHNEEILRRVLGLPDAEIAELRREQIIGEWPAALLEQAGDDPRATEEAALARGK
jgi:crotonobetainyl-CoA:carnitine CoA-transferase CaiB-like acyl-CoA transferase